MFFYGLSIEDINFLSVISGTAGVLALCPFLCPGFNERKANYETHPFVSSLDMAALREAGTAGRVAGRTVLWTDGNLGSGHLLY